MKIKDIEVGKEYAFARSAADEHHERVKVVDIRDVATRAWSSSSSHVRKVIIQSLHDDGTPLFAETPVMPAQILHSWADELTHRRQREAAEKVLQARQAKRAQAQQAAIDHMRSLVPESAWAKTDDGLGRPLEFQPGATPRISVADLTLLLKAARTDALEEAGGE